MTNILKKLRAEYYFKKVKNFTNPKIYPKIIGTKSISNFSKKEKTEILEKYDRWYVYFNFINPKTEVMTRQPPIYMKINKNYKDFNSRAYHFLTLQKNLQKLLDNGYSPYVNEVEEELYTAESSLDFAISLKTKTLKETSIEDYTNRLNHFKQFLRQKGLLKSPITDISKKHVIEFLNNKLNASNSGARNRNNTQTVISSLFTILEDNDIIENNFIKNIKKPKSTPKKNKAFTPDELIEVLQYFKKVDVNLYNYCAHIYYGLFRPVEIVRTQIKFIDIKRMQIESNTKTGYFFKQIPEILFDEFYSKLDLKSFNKDSYLFTRLGKPAPWEVKERNRRSYFGKRFQKILKENKEFKFSNEYTPYSFRHSAIGKLFVEKVKDYKKNNDPNFEEKALNYIRRISLHKDNGATRNYLREIGYYKIDDWSHLLK